MGHSDRSHHRSRRHEDDYDMYFGGYPFTFRDPEDVFKEFFNDLPFGDIFGGKLRPFFSCLIFNGFAIWYLLFSFLFIII